MFIESIEFIVFFDSIPYPLTPNRADRTGRPEGRSARLYRAALAGVRCGNRADADRQCDGARRRAGPQTAAGGACRRAVLPGAVDCAGRVSVPGERPGLGT